jgi:DHA2 family multidrug resistance protein
MIGAAALLAFFVQQCMAKVGACSILPCSNRRNLLHSPFAVSFVAGAALFGSSYLIPSFAVSVLALTPTDAGQLLAAERARSLPRLC